MKLKIAAYVILLLFISSKLYAQLNTKLCNKNEVVVFAFQIQNKKWISVCKEEKEKYLVYRFGTAAKIELQYPLVLDSSSWQKFSFKGYTRGGGKQNAAMNFAFLDFRNNDIDYEVYESWNSEDNKEHCGVSVMIGNKTTDMEGILKTRKGYLLTLSENDKIKQEE